MDLIISNASIIDGRGTAARSGDVAIVDDRIIAIGDLASMQAHQRVDAGGLVLAPGFIDVHTHDDIEVIRNPLMECKLSQGVTTVIVGNCGISATPVTLSSEPPDPMNLLGQQHEFCYPNFADYVAAVNKAQPGVNVAALIGHTALRNNVMEDLYRAATDDEITRMSQQLRDALDHGALGMSSGLAYGTANCAPASELETLAKELNAFNAIYTTHLRTEFGGITDAMKEAFRVGRVADVPVVISHLKCAGKENWGRSDEVLGLLKDYAQEQPIACDCYPYSASSSTLDLKQVTSDFEIFITWSEAFPNMAGQSLKAIADHWQLSLLDAAKKLQPAGAVYHGMDEADVQNVLQYKGTMIGSDGLPCDPIPHPRLWGSFPRVLGHYSRDVGLFELSEAVSKMTALPAKQFGLEQRGAIEVGNFADMVLFDPQQIADSATFLSPTQAADGIHSVWVNGKLSYQHKQNTPVRAGQFLKHNPNTEVEHDD